MLLLANLSQSFVGMPHATGVEHGNDVLPQLTVMQSPYDLVAPHLPAAQNLAVSACSKAAAIWSATSLCGWSACKHWCQPASTHTALAIDAR